MRGFRARRHYGFFLLPFLILSVESLDAMRWGIKNESCEKFNVSFPGNDDVVISCDEKSWASLEEKSKEFFKRNGDMLYYSKSDRDLREFDGRGEESYFPEDQKLVCNGTPKDMSVAELAEIIKTQKVIFYTGAGISAGAVPTMNELMNDLGMFKNLKKGRGLQNYIAAIVSNPDSYRFF
ncbi:MAG: hypothetical protein LBO73_02330 [Holosporaceae bacterium]|jgi:hypothetical protein|nr:hypothetical protein [Holosporaceae bacterium]